MTNGRKGGEADATLEWARAAIQQGRADEAERLEALAPHLPKFR